MSNQPTAPIDQPPGTPVLVDQTTGARVVVPSGSTVLIDQPPASITGAAPTLAASAGVPHGSDVPPVLPVVVPPAPAPTPPSGNLTLGQPVAFDYVDPYSPSGISTQIGVVVATNDFGHQVGWLLGPSGFIPESELRVL